MGQGLLRGASGELLAEPWGWEGGRGCGGARRMG